MPSFNKVILRNLLYIYVIIVLLLVILPLNSATTANDIFVLNLRADYLFHIIMFLPWMFFHNAAFGNLRSGRSFWPLAFSFWSDGKIKDKRKKTKGKRKKNLSQSLSLSHSLSQSQQLSWLLTGLLFASATEGLQYFLPYRAFNINDLLANLLGVMVGFAVLILYHFTAKNLHRR